MAKYDSLSELTKEDRLDSRDLVELIDELETMEPDRLDLDEWDAWEGGDEAELLDALREFRGETEGYSGDTWRDGVFFIADDDFETYAQELADDIGAIDGDTSWPLTCIDWEQAADELKMDYTFATIGDRDYRYR